MKLITNFSIALTILYVKILCDDIDPNILNKIILKYKQAEKYDKDFINDTAKYQDATYRAKLYYSNIPMENYIVTYPNETYYLIRIYIDPCENFEENCCQGKASCEEDNTDIIAGKDLEVAWFINNFLPICENEFKNQECGTFLEVHLPGNENVIVEKQIQQYYFDGFQTNFISTTYLCAGRFEVL